MVNLVITRSQSQLVATRDSRNSQKVERPGVRRNSRLAAANRRMILGAAAPARRFAGLSQDHLAAEPTTAGPGRLALDRPALRTQTGPESRPQAADLVPVPARMPVLVPVLVIAWVVDPLTPQKSVSHRTILRTKVGRLIAAPVPDRVCLR